MPENTSIESNVSERIWGGGHVGFEEIQRVIHNVQSRASPAGQTHRAVGVPRKEHRKLGVRGRPGKENKNTEFPSLPAPGTVSPLCYPVTGEQ